MDEKKIRDLPASTVAPERMLRWFTWEHLPPDLQIVSRLFSDVAKCLIDALPAGPERTVALRKLLESKDAAVRARIEARDGSPT